MGWRRRQEQRYRLLYERNWRKVGAYVERRCANRAAAEDVVADVFVVAWRRIDDIRSDNELPWLLGVARRTLANSRRSSIRQQRLVERLQNGWVNDSPADTKGSGTSNGQDTSEPVEKIRAALARLRPFVSHRLDIVAEGQGCRRGRRRQVLVELELQPELGSNGYNSSCASRAA